MVARLFVLAGHPHNGRGRGHHILTTMRALSANLKEELVDLWDMIIPKLLTYLQGQPVTQSVIVLISLSCQFVTVLASLSLCQSACHHVGQPVIDQSVWLSIW